MSEEEATQSFMNSRQRENLGMVDSFRLAAVLSKFCAKNCGLFKKSETEEFPSDCLKNCADNVERTYEKFTSNIKASLLESGEAEE